MKPRLLLRLAWLMLMLLILVGLFSAFATANTVTESGLHNFSQTITANHLKPAACATLNLDNIVANGNGGPGNDLILGTAGANALDGGDGDDCIVGGDGDDSLQGGNGNDILLGGNGSDSLSGDDGPGDECYGEGGVDTFNPSCETQVQ